jgi:hypothetical protein
VPPAAIRSTSFDSVDCLLVVVGFSLSSGNAGNPRTLRRTASSSRIALEAPFPNCISEDGRWNAEQQAVEFEVEIGEYRGVVRVPRRVFQRLLPELPTPSAVLRRTDFSGRGSRASPSGSCDGAS